MPRIRRLDEGLIAETRLTGECNDPSELVVELRNLASLTAEVADALSESLLLGEGLRLCAEAVVHNLGAAFARIWTLNEKDQVLELQASAGMYTHLDGPHSRIPVGHLKIGQIAQTRTPLLTNTVFGDPRVNDQEWARREGMVAFAGYPLLVAGRVTGVMALFARHPLTQTTLEALGTVAHSIAHGIDRWRIIEALHASEERFTLAIQSTDQGIWDWKVLTDEVYLTPRFKELLGYEEHEVESSYSMWESRLHPEDRERVLSALRHHLEERHPFEMDYRLRTKSGEYRWFQARGQTLWDDNNQPIRMVGFITDISQRKVDESRWKAIHQVVEILAEATDLTDSLPRILAAICKNLNWELGEFWVRDPHSNVLRLAAIWHQPAASLQTFRVASQNQSFPQGVGLPGRTWASARLEWIEDVTRDPDFSRAAEAVEAHLRGGIAFPVLIQSQVHGVMEFFSQEVLKPDEQVINFFLDISRQISRFIALQQEQQKERQHQNEMEVARQIQQQMFPRDMPVLEGLTIAGASRPANATGGDYFDFIDFSDGQLLLALGDVSGHGLGPALLVATARAYIRILSSTEASIDRIVELANNKLFEDADAFMTLFLAVINPSSRSLVYCNAGHCPGLIIDASGAVRRTLSSTRLPLGVVASGECETSAVSQLLPGDLLLLISDGVFEACSPDGKAFGMARVLDTVCAARHEPPPAVIASLFRAVDEFSQAPLHDDMTAIVVKVTDTQNSVGQKDSPSK